MFVGPIKNLAALLEWSKEKLIINDAIRHADDGIYSWLLKEGGFSMLPVESEQEIVSVHANLWSWTPTMGRVVAAGELRKKGDAIFYNLQSGSFMQPVLKTAKLQRQYIVHVSKRFREIGLTPKFLMCAPDGNAICKEEYERLSGKSIVETAKIVTSHVNLFWYRQFFNEAPDNAPTPRAMAKMMDALGANVGGSRRRLRSKARTRRASTRRRASI
jgi:hypothetical protein